jgi:phosphatidate cytidylyltransferase
MLKKRILTALIALPLVLSILYFAPKILIFALFLLLALGTTYETGSIVIPALRSKLGSPMYASANLWVLFCTFVSGIVFSCLAYRLEGVPLGIGVFAIMILLLLANFLSKSIEDSMANMLGALFSVMYGCLPWVSLLDLYEYGEHSRYLFLLLGIVMANDSVAYFVGKYLGKHPLAPLSSPKKTWEGAFGGLLGGVLGAWIINSLFWGELGTWTFLAIVAILTGIAGILGDLTESALKRFGGVKDSGTIFPGHGGVLDRTDSIVFAAPILWFLLFMTKVEFSFF